MCRTTPDTRESGVNTYPDAAIFDVQRITAWPQSRQSTNTFPSRQFVCSAHPAASA